jgi:hypothetical protein
MLREVAKDRNASPRERVAAGRALISAGKANLDSIRTAVFGKRLGDDDERFAGAREVSKTLKELLADCLAEGDDKLNDIDPFGTANGRGL